MSDYFDRDGRPIGHQEAYTLLDDPAYRQVAETTEGRLLVSTVWLGLDHAFGGPVPLIFETMVFPLGSRALGGEYLKRYSSEEAAVAGHERAVQWARRNQPAEGAA